MMLNRLLSRPRVPFKRQQRKRSGCPAGHLSGARLSRLAWCKRPQRKRVRSRGLRQRWVTGCGAYRVDRFPELGAVFFPWARSAAGGWELLGECSGLWFAKRECQRHADRMGARR